MPEKNKRASQKILTKKKHKQIFFPFPNSETWRYRPVIPCAVNGHNHVYKILDVWETKVKLLLVALPSKRYYLEPFHYSQR